MTVLVILIAALCLYLPFLGVPFIYDDLHSVAWNQAVHSWDRLGDVWTNPSLFSSTPLRGMYRPMLLISYMVSSEWGITPEVYRIGNLLIHLLVGVLVYALTKKMFGPTKARWAMALFLLHPAFSEPVFYISSRSESLLTLFAVAALWAYAHDRRISAVLFGALALLSKESAVMLLPVLVWYDYCLWPERGSYTWRVALRRHWPLGLLTVGYLWVSWNFGLLRGAGTRAGREWSVQLWTQLSSLREYLAALLWPTNWSIDGTMTEQVGPSWVGATGVLLVVVCTLWAIQCGGRRTLFLYGAAWLSFLPTLIIPLNVLMSERRLYWPGIFLCMGAGVMMDKVGQRMGRVGIAILLVGLGALGVLIYQRGLRWEFPEEVWAVAAEEAPSYRSLMNYGSAAAQAGKYDEAVVAMKRAVAAAGTAEDRSLALGNLGSAYFSQGMLDTAFACYVQAIQQDSLQSSLWANLGTLWYEMGKRSSGEDRRVRWKGAESYLRHSIVLDKSNQQAHLGLSVLLEIEGMKEESEAERVLGLGAQPKTVLVPYTGP